LSSKFQHGIDDIVAALMVARGLGADYSSWATSFRADTAPNIWPVVPGQEPTEPDNVITVYETEPIIHCKLQPTGEQPQHYGFTVRVRGITKNAARQKAEDIRWDFDERCHEQTVTLDGQEYYIPCIARTMLIRPIREATIAMDRWFVNVNCTAAIRAYPLTG
jgi:hypothetical protein